NLIALAGQIVAAASGAASGSRPGGFAFPDPTTALPWAVPLLLIAPFATFLLALSSVRTRRSASATAMFGTAVMLVVTLLVLWGLAELFGFWMIGGALTYLLLAHRWGVAEPAARARVALALPFFTDVCLLSGIAWLYSRYGTQTLDTLVPVLHTNPGWTVRSLVVASVLLFVGVGGRIALWPFTSWITQTAVTAPAAASAIVQSVWSVAGIVVLYRLTPIFASSNQ